MLSGDWLNSRKVNKKAVYWVSRKGNFAVKILPKIFPRKYQDHLTARYLSICDHVNHPILDY